MEIHGFVQLLFLCIAAVLVVDGGFKENFLLRVSIVRGLQTAQSGCFGQRCVFRLRSYGISMLILALKLAFVKFALCGGSNVLVVVSTRTVHWSLSKQA